MSCSVYLCYSDFILVFRTVTATVPRNGCLYISHCGALRFLNMYIFVFTKFRDFLPLFLDIFCLVFPVLSFLTPINIITLMLFDMSFFFNLYSQSFDWDVSLYFFNFIDSFFWQPWLAVNKPTHLIVFLFSVLEFYLKYNFPFSKIIYLFIITIFCLNFF